MKLKKDNTRINKQIFFTKNNGMEKITLSMNSGSIYKIIFPNIFFSYP